VGAVLRHIEFITEKNKNLKGLKAPMKSRSSLWQM